MSLGIALSLSLMASTSSSAAAYPASVVATGTQAAYDTKTTSGYRTLTKVPNSGQGAIDVAAAAGSISGNIITFNGTGNYTLSGIDFSGYELDFKNTGTWSVTDYKIYANGQQTTYNITLQTGAIVSLAFGLVDCGSIPAQADGGFYQILGAGQLTVSDSKILRGQQTTIQLRNNAVFTRCYFDAPGQNALPAGHCESIKGNDASAVCSYCYFDNVVGAVFHDGTTNGGMTGVIFSSADSGPASLILDHCVMPNVAPLNSNYAIQIGATAPFRSIFVATNCAVSKGTSGYFANAASTYASYVSMSNTGCVDFDSNAAIPDVQAPFFGSTTRTWGSTAAVFGKT